MYLLGMNHKEIRLRQILFLFLYDMNVCAYICFQMRKHSCKRPPPALPPIPPSLGPVTRDGLTCSAVSHRHVFWSNVMYARENTVRVS